MFANFGSHAFASRYAIRLASPIGLDVQTTEAVSALRETHPGEPLGMLTNLLNNGWIRSSRFILEILD